MDDVILQELKRTVEQAVQPVRATMARKRQVREELLTHLVAIFEEEVGRLGDERAALDQARRRFGDPRELAGQLQQAVPRWDRCRSILENMGYQPNESAWHLAGKHFLAMLLIYSVCLPTWMLVTLCAHGGLGILGPVESQRLYVLALVLGIPVIALLNVVFSLVLAGLLGRTGPALAAKRRGRIALAVMCGFAVLSGVTPYFTGAAILLPLMVWQIVKQWHYQADWA